MQLVIFISIDFVWFIWFVKQPVKQNSINYFPKQNATCNFYLKLVLFDWFNLLNNGIKSMVFDINWNISSVRLNFSSKLALKSRLWTHHALQITDQLFKSNLTFCVVCVFMVFLLCRPASLLFLIHHIVNEFNIFLYHRSFE
jgi:hypothetical protein